MDIAGASARREDVPSSSGAGRKGATALPFDWVMPSTGRMRAPAHFRLVYREGTKISNELFTVYVRPTSGGERVVGVAVPGRIGTAVQRNRLKRRVREAVQRCAERMPPGIDAVIIPRPRAEAAPFSALAAALCRLLARSAASPREGAPPEPA